MQVYLIAAPEDASHGAQLAGWLKQRGAQVREDYGKFGYPQIHSGEVVLALWSRAAMFSVKRMLLTRRAVSAWEDGHLVMAKLDQGLRPPGLGDLDMVDLTFQAARTHRYPQVLAALQAAARPPEPPALSEQVMASVEPEPALEAFPHVFVSYAHADADHVLPLVDKIEASGTPMWIDRGDLKAGQGWSGSIVRAIKDASRFCLMCSEASFASHSVLREVHLAAKYQKSFLPILLDDAELNEDMEYFLVNWQWADFSDLTFDAQVTKLSDLLDD